jgi:myo-inositol-1(or 4)-monophosphatase
VTDWLELCRAAVADVEAVLERLPTRAEREPVVGAGEGGDETTAIDQAAEDVIVERFRATGASLVSEEVGLLAGSEETVVVIDPIDGSLNAKRGIPFFSVSIAVASGRTMDDVHFAFVHDFGAGEEWLARKGEGAWLNGAALGGVRPKETVEILSFEATRTSLVAQEAPKVAELAHRLRVMGSLALSLCHLAAGRVDAVVSLKPARSVDIAAAQLLCRELGYAVDLFDVEEPFGVAPLDLGQRSRVVAAGTDGVCSKIARALSA